MLVPDRPAPGENWYDDDPALRAVLAARLGAELAKEEARLRSLGLVAPAEVDALARRADKVRPRLEDGEVVLDASYEGLRRLAREHEAFTYAWRGGSRVAHFALGYLYAQAESGYYCPGCMTDGAAFVLARHGDAAQKERYVTRLVQHAVEGAFEGAMYLTERGGGSDVGAGTATTAQRAPDGTWRLTGEKWFASNCTADVALALARLPDGAPGTDGLGLFVVPKTLPDGRRNPGLKVAKLKDKLGVTSMPTGEVLLEGALAEPVEGGFHAMAEMVNLSRLYNSVASVAVARRAVREGLRAARSRVAFGKPLAEQPLFLRSVLDVAVDVEAALAATLDVAEVFERHAAGDAEAGGLLRLLTPAAKASTAKLAVRAASEACEWLGGVGYVEDWVTPRLLRDAQVLPIWEGTTNVQALEFSKSLAKEGMLDRFGAHVRGLLAKGDGRTLPAVEAGSRRLPLIAREVGRLARSSAAEREAASLRLLGLAWDAHCSAALVHAAGASGDARTARMANLHAAVRLAESADAAGRALERAVATGEAARVLFA